MKNQIVILEEWENKMKLLKLKEEVESQLQEDFSISYLMVVKKKNKKEEFPYVPNTKFITKKDFSLFGKLKNKKIEEMIHQKDGFLISLLKNKGKIQKRIIKETKLITVGLDQPNLPNFELAFRNTDNQKLLKTINNYITKIQ